MSDPYSKKESYISNHTDPLLWRKHANYYILYHYKHFIKGEVADLGCNHCALSILLHDFNPYKIYCFDVNLNALQIGCQTAASMGLANDMVFIQTNLVNIQALGENINNKFDFVLSMHTLEHIYPHDAQTVAKEMFNIIKPGGFLVISIPYENSYPDPAHVAFYNERSLSSLMQSVGFVCMEVFKDDRFEQKNLLTGLFFKTQNTMTNYFLVEEETKSDISLNAWISNHNQQSNP